MREILFRGKVKGSRKWVCGYFYKDESGAYIKDSARNKRFGCGFPVISETVGQFTGLKDKNGINIFEGDIVESEHSTFNVDFRDGSFIIIHEPTCRSEIEGECKTDILDKRCVDIYSLEVLGNIHDK